MAEEDRTVTQRRRARRPTEAAARLDRLRKRNADQLEAQREAERRVESALQAYVDADISISAVEQTRDEKVSGLERQIELARTSAQEEIEQIRARQAMAVWQINDAGRTLEQITELLELPEKEARRLLRVGRATANTDSGDRNHDDALAIQQPQSLEEQGLSGIDAEQDSPDTLLVPAVADSGRESA
jgi:transcription initiation factor TFIIIB Brf1 subunit/transcription initiation factor TFIIB